MKRIEKNALYFDVKLGERSFEVMYETGGKFKGMVHIFDKGKTKHRCADIVVSGAAFVAGNLVVTEDDVFEVVDGLLEVAEANLSRYALN